MKTLINLFLLIAIGFGIYGAAKPLPPDVNIGGSLFAVPESGVSFFEDRTYVTGTQLRQSEQEIFDEIFRMINSAEHYVLVDMFLYNDFLGTETKSYRQLSSELTTILVQKKKANPDMTIVVITDPINELYGGYVSSQFESLRNAGVEVVVTDLDPLRDSNPLFSAFYRAYVQWFSNSPTDRGFLANPFDTRLPDLGIRTYLSLFNFKANHRKIVMADSITSTGQKLSVLVTSANPHDGSSAHTNTAVRVDDFLWKEVLRSELAVGKFSDIPITPPSETFISSINDTKGGVFAQLLTEEAIRTKVVAVVDSLGSGHTLDLAMFYLADRKIINALKEANERGVKIRVLLDPNRDAFGREKNGVPNRSVAHELVTSGPTPPEVRWCDTHGEQCHTKLLLAKTKTKFTMIQGSANYTRRNLGNYNLETNISIEAATEVQAIRDANNYFETVWGNKNGKRYSASYETFADSSKKRSLMYRIMEDLGTSTF